MKKILVIIITMFLCVFLIGCEEEKITEEIYNAYLNENVKALNLEEVDNFSNLGFLNSDMKKSDLILIGEGHGTKANYSIKMKFLKYMSKNFDLKYLLLEGSYVNSIKINRYLDTGDEKLLDDIYFFNKEDYEFYKELYKFNSTLDKKDRIITLGIDAATTDETLNYLQEELSKIKLDSKSKEHLKKIVEINKISTEVANNNSVNKEDYNNVKQSILKLYEEMNGYKDYYKKNLSKENNRDLFLVLNSIYNTQNAVNFDDENKNLDDILSNITNIRDNIMYNNFKTISKYFNEGKYFGQFGGQHCYTASGINLSDELKENRSFGTLINEDNNVKMITIMTLYENCNHYLNDVINYTDYNNNNIIEKHINTDNSIIKLNGEKSPYSKALDQNLLTGDEIILDNDKVTTDYFQYIILVKNSLQVEPLE